MTPELRRLATQAYIQRIAKSGRPILLGPWRSEVGFESLYALPFYRWAKTFGGIKGERLFAVTRGGAGCLYPYPSVDLYSLRSVKTVREENAYDAQRTGIQKQLSCTPWDRDVLKEAAAHLLGRGEKYYILHPSWMYWALAPFWEEQRGFNYLSSLTQFANLPTQTADVQGLPEKFVAVKWYTRATFPPSDEVKAFVSQVTATLAQQTPVVVLTSGHDGDDHSDLVVEGPNIAVMPRVEPDKSLTVQAAILSRASAFVGTYGGVAQLALRLGIPSASFYTQFGGTAYGHLALSQWLGIKTGVPFLTGSLHDSQLWRQVLSVPAPAKQVAA